MLRDPGLIPLSHDHHHALKLCVLTRRALPPGASPAAIAAQAQEIVHKFDEEIHDHFVFEEQTVFPLLVSFPAIRNLIADLLKDHRTMEAFIERMRAPVDWSVIDDFCDTLEQHVRKEEQLLFEEAQRVLTRQQLDEIGLQRKR